MSPALVFSRRENLEGGMPMKRFLGSSLIVLTFLALVLSPLAAEERLNLPLENSPSLGPENAPVLMVEFIDFQ